MKINDVNKIADKYFNTVVGSRIADDMPEHLIEGFNVKSIGGTYHIFVFANNPNHIIRNVEKSLEDWLKDNKL